MTVKEFCVLKREETCTQRANQPKLKAQVKFNKSYEFVTPQQITRK